MFSTSSKQDDNELCASCNNSLAIAKNEILHTIGKELIVQLLTR